MDFNFQKQHGHSPGKNSFTFQQRAVLLYWRGHSYKYYILFSDNMRPLLFYKILMVAKTFFFFKQKTSHIYK